MIRRREISNETLSQDNLAALRKIGIVAKTGTRI
jgi:hypothetical protein